MIVLSFLEMILCLSNKTVRPPSQGNWTAMLRPTLATLPPLDRTGHLLSQIASNKALKHRPSQMGQLKHLLTHETQCQCRSITAFIHPRYDGH